MNEDKKFEFHISFTRFGNRFPKRTVVFANSQKDARVEVEKEFATKAKPLIYFNVDKKLVR